MSLLCNYGNCWLLTTSFFVYYWPVQPHLSQRNVPGARENLLGGDVLERGTGRSKTGGLKMSQPPPQRSQPCQLRSAAFPRWQGWLTSRSVQRPEGRTPFTLSDPLLGDRLPQIAKDGGATRPILRSTAGRGANPRWNDACWLCGCESFQVCQAVRP